MIKQAMNIITYYMLMVSYYNDNEHHNLLYNNGIILSGKLYGDFYTSQTHVTIHFITNYSIIV